MNSVTGEMLDEDTGRLSRLIYFDGLENICLEDVTVEDITEDDVTVCGSDGQRHTVSIEDIAGWEVCTERKPRKEGDGRQFHFNDDIGDVTDRVHRIFGKGVGRIHYGRETEDCLDMLDRICDIVDKESFAGVVAGRSEKKDIVIDGGYKPFLCYCPNCHAYLGAWESYQGDPDMFCRKCGQALKVPVRGKE